MKMLTRRWITTGFTFLLALSVVGRSQATTIELDIARTTIGGDFLLNGTSPPASLYESGDIYLRNLRTNDEVFLGRTRDGSYAVSAIPGRYDVHYERQIGGSSVPLNGDAIVGRLTVPPPSEVMAMRDIEIAMGSLSGSILVNGNTAPDSLYENGRIWAYDRRTEDEFAIGETNDGGFQDVLVVEGRYDLFYERVVGGNLVPRNERAFLTSVNITAADQFQLVSPVPEPSSGALAGLATLLMVWRSRFRAT